MSERIEKLRLMEKMIRNLEYQIARDYNLYMLELQDEMKIEYLKNMEYAVNQLKEIYKEKIRMKNSTGVEEDKS